MREEYKIWFRDPKMIRLTQPKKHRRPPTKQMIMDMVWRCVERIKRDTVADAFTECGIAGGGVKIPVRMLNSKLRGWMRNTSTKSTERNYYGSLVDDTLFNVGDEDAEGRGEVFEDEYLVQSSTRQMMMRPGGTSYLCAQ